MKTPICSSCTVCLSHDRNGAEPRLQRSGATSLTERSASSAAWLPALNGALPAAIDAELTRWLRRACDETPAG